MVGCSLDDGNNRKKKQCGWHAATNTTGERPTDYWWYSFVPMPMK